MRSHYSVRLYAPADFDEIMILWQSLGLGSPQRGDDRQVIERTLETGGKLLVLFETDSGKIAGTSWLTTDGRRTYLHHFGIAGSLQGIGLANLLMDESMKVAKLMGMQIKLEVHRDNLKALSLYRKFGFSYLGDYAVYIIRDISHM